MRALCRGSGTVCVYLPVDKPQCSKNRGVDVDIVVKSYGCLWEKSDATWRKPLSESTLQKEGN